MCLRLVPLCWYCCTVAPLPTDHVINKSWTRWWRMKSQTWTLTLESLTPTQQANKQTPMVSLRPLTGVHTTVMCCGTNLRWSTVNALMTGTDTLYKGSLCQLDLRALSHWGWCITFFCPYNKLAGFNVVLGFVSSLSAGSAIVLIPQVYIYFSVGLLRVTASHTHFIMHHVTQQWQHSLWVFPDLVSYCLIALNYC